MLLQLITQFKPESKKRILKSKSKDLVSEQVKNLLQSKDQKLILMVRG